MHQPTKEILGLQSSNWTGNLFSTYCNGI